jgi:hypothetical protein
MAWASRSCWSIEVKRKVCDRGGVAADEQFDVAAASLRRSPLAVSGSTGEADARRDLAKRLAGVVAVELEVKGRAMFGGYELVERRLVDDHLRDRVGMAGRELEADPRADAGGEQRCGACAEVADQLAGRRRRDSGSSPARRGARAGCGSSHAGRR